MMINSVFCIFMKEPTQFKELVPKDVWRHLRAVLFQYDSDGGGD